MFFPISMLKDQTHHLYMGDFALTERNLITQTERTFAWDATIPVEPVAWSLYEADDGTIWLGTDRGLGYLDKKSETLQLAQRTNQAGKLAHSFIYGFTESKQGHVWLATNQGLYAWKPGQGILDRWGAEETGRSFIPHEQIMHVHEDESGVVWLATAGGGLIRLETLSVPSSETSESPPSPSRHYRQFTIADGLSNNTLYAIYEDQQEHLWMSSDYGIIRFDKTTHRARAYLPKDGITHHEFNRTSHFRSDDGTIYFGGLNGVTAFHPKDFYASSNDFSPSLQITRYDQFDNETNQFVDRTEALQQSRRIVLKPGDRFFRLEYALLDYSNPEQIRYAWMLEGLDDEWNHTEQNFIRISGLPAGTYTLRVRGQGADGRWSTQEIHLPVQVLRPLHETVGFWLLIGTLFFGLGLGFYVWRMQQLRNRQAELERMVKERTQTIIEQSEELVHLDQMKSRFFANVSHELRTPLTLMLGPIGSALKDPGLNSKTAAYLSLAQENGQKLLKLIHELLSLSKMEAGKLQLEEEAVKLLPMLRRMLAQFEAHAQRQGITITFQFQAEPRLSVKLDPAKFEVIFNNLLSNALKFTPRGGSIDLLLTDTDTQLRLSISDTGTGIHPDDLPRIFNRFYQAKHPSGHVVGGTGIGLSLSQEYAKLFGGHISVTSEVGKGSTFTFAFPKKEVFGGSLSTHESLLASADPSFVLPKQQPPKGLLTEGVSLDPQRKTLLLVEDNYSLRQYINLVLSETYNLICAENGETALNILNDSSFVPPRRGRAAAATRGIDLIISDVMMPIMDGFEFLEALRNDEQWCHVPVIMLTARVEMRDKLKALRIGVDDYMIKPFEEAELVARVQNILKHAEERHHQAEEERLPGANSSAREAVATQPRLKAEELAWLERLEHTARGLLGEFQTNIDDLADHMAMSRRQLHRKIKQLVGLTPNQYLLEIRLQQARHLLEDEQVRSVKSAAYEVGMKDVRYFSQKFKERFGKLPSSYLGS